MIMGIRCLRLVFASSHHGGERLRDFERLGRLRSCLSPLAGLYTIANVSRTQHSLYATGGIWNGPGVRLRRYDTNSRWISMRCRSVKCARQELHCGDRHSLSLPLSPSLPLSSFFCLVITIQAHIPNLLSSIHHPHH